MQAVYLEQGKVEVRDVPVPDRPPGYALLRLLKAGICNTDLELKRGYYGFSGVPGHEFVAEVAEADDKTLPGRRVVGEINLACRSCPWCARDLGRHCPHRTVLGIVNWPGAFQELFVLPEANLLPVPDELSTEEAVFTEPLAAACEILEQVHLTPGQPVAVLGDGKLGLLIAQVLAVAGAQVHLYGRHAEKMAIAAIAGALPRLSADGVTAAYPVVVDATGSAAGLAQAIRMTEPRGTVVMKSTVAGDVSFDAAAVIVNEISLVGSRCGRFAPALELLRKRRVDVRPMIQAELPLADAPEAFARAEEKGSLKILLRP